MYMLFLENDCIVVFHTSLYNYGINVYTYVNDLYDHEFAINECVYIFQVFIKNFKNTYYINIMILSTMSSRTMLLSIKTKININL